MLISKTEFIFFTILFLLLVSIFGLNWYAGSSITSPAQLAIDLASPPDSPQTWMVQDWIPTKYRALFRWIVFGTFTLLFSSGDAVGFYISFVAWGFVFFYATLIALYYYLRILEFNSRSAFIGCLLFLASPPVMMAYKYPVYTREDSLAYFLVLLGLIALFKQKPVWVALIASFAAITRETTLILPLAYLFAARDSWRNRIFVCVPPVLATIGIRLFLGLVLYDPFESSRYNFETPWQTIAFAFCIFGALWLPFLLGMREGNQTTYAWHVISSTAPLVLLIVFGTHIALARAREIRISFLMFPWVIPLALDWFRANAMRLRTLIVSRGFGVFAASIFAGLTLIILYFSLGSPALMRDYLADFKNGYWLGIADIHLAATIAMVVALLINRFRLQTQST